MARSFLFALLLSSVHCLAPFFPVRVSFSPAPPVSLHPVPYSFLRPPLLFLSFRRPGPTCSRLFLCHLACPFLTLGLSPYSSSLLLPFSSRLYSIFNSYRPFPPREVFFPPRNSRLERFVPFFVMPAPWSGLVPRSGVFSLCIRGFFAFYFGGSKNFVIFGNSIYLRLIAMSKALLAPIAFFYKMG